MQNNIIQQRISTLWVSIALLIIVILHMSIIIIAQPLSTGYVDNYYQHHVGDISLHNTSDDQFDLQWPEQLYVHTDNDITLYAKTFYNQVINISSADVHFYRPDGAEQDINTELLPMLNGSYRTTINFSAPGLWHMHMLLHYQGQKYLLDHEFVVVYQPLNLPQRGNSLGPKKEKKVEAWSTFFIRVLLGKAKE